MLSQNHKTIRNTLTSVVLSITALGGVVNAQQNGVNAQQNGVNAQQNGVNAQQNGVNAQQNDSQYRFPPANAAPQAAPAPAAVNRAYPMPYPAQRQAPYGAPRAPAYGAPRAPAYGAPRAPAYGAPRAPTYGAPRAPTYGAPRAPAYGSAPYGRPGSRPMPQPFAAPMRSGPGTPPSYGMPYNNRPVYGAPYGNNPYNRGPYNRGNNNGPFGNSPFNNFGGGPFNGNSAPWETWPFGSEDSFWSRKELPFKQQNPTDWFQPGDPKEGMAIMWDDLIAAPDDLGTMPGGWNVPSISVPNPVDLEDQLEKASKEIPDLIRVYND